MWDTEERRKYMELNGIDPYKVLGAKKTDTLKSIKKKYHALALQSHPDKQTKSSKKLLDFKILKECYLFIKDEMEIITYDDTKCVTLQELKEQRNEPVIYDEGRNLFSTNFEDPEIRKTLFPNDDVPFGVKTERTTETTYSNMTVPVPENIFGKKKFNLKYFNEVFDAKKELNKALQIFKEPESMDCQSSLNCGGIAKYAGVIIEDSRNASSSVGNFSTFKPNSEQKDIPLKKLKKIVKTMKKLAKEETLEDVETLFNRKKSQGTILPPERISMVEAEERLRKINLENTRDLLRKNKEYITQKLHVYPENFKKNLEF